jgi:cystathionine beta-lyase/cystathionine gamma-synthase
MKFETLAVHAAAGMDAATGAITPPIHLSTTFHHTPEGAPLGGFTYTRRGNPNQSQLETALAAIEGGEAALVFGAGVAAGAALLQSLEPGSHVLFHKDIYYTFKVMAEEFMPRWGPDASGYEPVWAGDIKVGFVTSGGYGHTLGRSLAMALVNRDRAEEGTNLRVHVVGVARGARVIAPSPYDPAGRAMRG